MPLSSDQHQRYARHLALPEIGESGQEALLRSRVLVVGCGGLGSPAAFYLAAAGIGFLGLMDGDCVDPSNLQRQILYSTEHIGKPKATVAASVLRDLNPDVHPEVYAEFLTAGNMSVIGDYDVVVDAVDSARTKLFIASACQACGVPYVYGGITEFRGQVMTVCPGRTACPGCLFGDLEKETSDRPPRGPIGALAGVIGSIQATEVIKLILGMDGLLTDSLLVYDALDMLCRRIPVRKNLSCCICA